jgi:hypothetical protein
MILPPSLAFTKKVPTTEATIDTAPSSSGNRMAFKPSDCMVRPASSMVATTVTA